MSPFRFPRWLPGRAEALSVRRLAVRNRGSSSGPASRKAEAPGPPDGTGRRSSRSAWQVMSRSPGSRQFAAPGPEGPVLPDRSEPKLKSRRWRRLSRSSAFRRAGPGPEGPVSCLIRSLREPESSSGSGWAPHDACRFRIRSRTSPQLPPGGGFVSRPALRAVASSPGGTRRSVSLGPWLGRLSSVAGRSSRPRTKAVMKIESHQADSGRFRLWKTRITGITESGPQSLPAIRRAPEKTACARIAASMARLAARARPA